MNPNLSLYGHIFSGSHRRYTKVDHKMFLNKFKKKKIWALHKLPDHSEIKPQINNIMKTGKVLNNWILNNTVLNNISQIHNFEKQAKYILS